MTVGRSRWQRRSPSSTRYTRPASRFPISAKMPTSRPSARAGPAWLRSRAGAASRPRATHRCLTIWSSARAARRSNVFATVFSRSRGRCSRQNWRRRPAVWAGSLVIHSISSGWPSRSTAYPPSHGRKWTTATPSSSSTTKPASCAGAAPRPARIFSTSAPSPSLARPSRPTLPPLWIKS